MYLHSSSSSVTVTISPPSGTDIMSGVMLLRVTKKTSSSPVALSFTMERAVHLRRSSSDIVIVMSVGR